MDETRFARPQHTSPLGKCSERIDVSIPEQLKADLAGLAFLYRRSLGEYVRDVLQEHTYGRIAIRERLGVVADPDEPENTR